MLEIIANGQSIDLPVDIQVSLIIENPFVLKDRIPTPYSLSFSLPPTNKNLRIFGYPNRLGTYQVKEEDSRILPCNIFFQGVKVASGVLEFSQFDKTIEAAFKGVQITENVRLPLFSTDMDLYNFTGGDYSEPDFDQPTSYAYKYKQWAVNAATGNNSNFVVAPIRVKTDMEAIEFIKYTDAGEKGVLIRRLSAEHLINTEYINFYNAQNGNLLLETSTSSTDNKYRHAPVFPFVRVHHALKLILNNELDDNFFSQGDLSELVVPSFYLQDWLPYAKYPELAGMLFNNEPPFFPILGPGGVTPGNPFITINTALSEGLASDFIKEVLTLFGATLVMVNGKFKIITNKSILEKDPTANWDDKLINTLALKDEKKRIYKYGYEGEDVYLPKERVLEFATIKQMVDYGENMNDETEVTRVFHITSTKQYFERKTTKEEFQRRISTNPSEYVTVTVIKTVYKVLDSGLGRLPDDSIRDETYDISSKLKPLPMSPEQYWWTSQVNISYPTSEPELAWWYVPKWEGERNKRSKEINIMIYKGLKNTLASGQQYPYLTAYDVDSRGNNIGNLTLSWEGDNGILNRFHKEYKEWIERDKARVSGTFLLSAFDLQRLDITEKKHLKGRNFFIEKIQVTFRNNRIDPAVIDFIEA